MLLVLIIGFFQKANGISCLDTYVIHTITWYIVILCDAFMLMFIYVSWLFIIYCLSFCSPLTVTEESSKISSSYLPPPCPLLPQRMALSTNDEAMKFDSTGMFYWCPNHLIDDVIMVVSLLFHTCNVL